MLETDLKFNKETGKFEGRDGDWKEFLSALGGVIGIALIILSLFVLTVFMMGCEENNFASPNTPAFTSVTVGGACAQVGSLLSISCRDSSLDPDSEVVDNGVRWTALLGNLEVDQKLGDHDGQVILTVRLPGTYVVEQKLINSDGNVIASKDHGVSVTAIGSE